MFVHGFILPGGKLDGEWACERSVEAGLGGSAEGKTCGKLLPVLSSGLSLSGSFLVLRKILSTLSIYTA